LFTNTNATFPLSGLRAALSRPCRRRAFAAVTILVLAVIAAAVLLKLHSGSLQIAGLWMRSAARSTPKLLAIVIFIVTYLTVAVGRLPGFKIDRAGAAFVGASLMIAFGVLPLTDAYRAIDFDTLTLLLGVMIVVADQRLSGLLSFASRAIVKRARHPLTLLIAVVALTGVLSAVLVNDTICLAMTPLVLDVVIENKRNPVPYLLAIAMGSNVGSAATITGNPQNMIIGGFAHIPYGRFAAALSPVAAIGLLLTVVLTSLVYPSEFLTRERVEGYLQSVGTNKPPIIRSALVSVAMVAGFFAGVTPARAAIAAGGVLLLSRRLECEEIYRQIHWTLLLMFVGLFIVVAGLERNVLTRQVIDAIGGLHLEDVAILSTLTTLLSNMVSNVPAVLVLKPLVASLRDHQRAWLTIAMASTLAGNLTLLGSVANLIVAQSAQARGIRIGFWDHFKIGAPLTIMTIAVGVFCL
jgi:Na+/H+ antiporter NhaD/arsenite permease-like protein